MKQTPTRKMAQWFKENIDPNSTTRTICLRFREAQVKLLMEKRITENHARVIVHNAWKMAGLPSIRTWNVVPDRITIIEERTEKDREEFKKFEDDLLDGLIL